MKNPKTHIESIRKDVFWIDDDRGCLAQQNPLSRKLKKAIEQLSEGLYSKDVHFIFELIQNAEDNRYGPRVDPSLSFRLTAEDPTCTPGAEGALIVENNELGFLPDNVDAICDVGRSTKTKQEGYIGEKGIGFKSVFQVSGNPHIFSSCYRFRLPEADEMTDLGYIVPAWVEPAPSSIQSNLTTIVLPLKRGRSSELSGSLRAIKPETILFLKKLKSLSIQIDDTYRCTVIKDAGAAPVVKLLCEIASDDAASECTEQLFWVRTATFCRPANILALKRENIMERDVTVALPLSLNGSNRGELYAYLPVLTRSKLPFLVNADFLLTTSREGIKEDEPWNHWLRDCIAPTFVTAFRELLLNADYRYEAYRYLPRLSDDSRQEFFEHVADKIHAELRNSPIIILQHRDELATPEHAKRANLQFRQLFSELQPPAELCASRLASSKIERFAPQLEELDVPVVTASDAVSCLEDKTWVSKRSLEWLVSCYGYLRALQIDGELKKQLRNCSIVPVEGHRLSCDAEQPIYFSCSEDDRTFLDAVPALIKTPVAFLRPGFTALVEQNLKLKVWMSEVLGVYDFNQGNYCVDIHNRLNRDYATLAPDAIIAGTRFLARFYDEKVSIKDLPIILTDGVCSLLNSVRSRQEIAHVVTPAGMEPRDGWQRMFEENDDRSHLAILTDQYLRDNVVSVDREILRRFFSRLGITDTPLPKIHITVGWDTTSQTAYERSCFAASRSERSSGLRTLRNPLSPSWLSVLAKGTTSDTLGQKSKAVIGWIRRQSASTLASRSEWAQSSYRGSRFMGFESQFLCDLKAAAWLPTTAGHVVPRSAFVKDQTIMAVLGQSVPYLSEDLPDWAIELLGIRTTATPKDLVGVLETQSEAHATNAQLASKVYGFLAHLGTAKSLRQIFSEKPLIHLPNHHRRWFKSTEVVWADRSGTFGDQFGYLEPAYQKMREFFVEELGVKPDVDAESFANRWLSLVGNLGSELKDIEIPMTQIFQALLPDCRRIRSGSVPPSWWTHFAKKVKLWCREKGFQSPDEAYVADDGELRRLFAKTPVAFAWRPEKASFADVEDIYRTLGARFLSESVSIDCLNTSAGRLVSKPRYLTSAAKAQILAWAGNSVEAEQQERMAREGLLKALISTQEERVENLQVIFRLGNSSSTDRRLAYWDLKRNRLFVEGIDEDPEALRQAVAETVAKGLMQNRPYRGVESLIFQVLCSDTAHARLFVSKRDWAIPPQAKSLLGDAHPSTPTPTPSVDDEPAGSNATVPAETAADATHDLDYRTELESVFQRHGATGSPVDEERHGPTPVSQPLHRRERTSAEIESDRSREPAREDRVFEVLRQEWECPDPVIKQQLIEEYQGRCQICNAGFPKRNGEPFFISKYLVSRTKARTIDRLGNVLCLCPTCAAKFQHGAVEMQDPLTQILRLRTRAEGGNGDLALSFHFCGQECRIVFSDRHLIDLQELIKTLQRK